jgi:hypothetical protein
MQHSAESTHNRDFLHEIETEFDNILWFLTGPNGPSIYEKNGGRKSRETVSLMSQIVQYTRNSLEIKFKSAVYGTVEIPYR